MKIDAPSGQSVPPAQRRPLNAADEATLKQAHQADRRATRGDDVAVSREAKHLNRVYAQLEALPDVRTDRVEQLRQAVQDGSYEIPLDLLAERLARLLG